MALSLALLREDLRSHLGMDDDDLPDAATDRLLNRSWWAIASQLRFAERESVFAFNTVQGTDEYDIPTDADGVQRVTIQAPTDSTWVPLIKIDDWNMFAKKDDEDEGEPTHYSRRDDKFVLWPNPDEEYSVRVKYLKTLADIEASGPDAPQEWHEVILWGAIARGFFIVGDWTRGTQAQAQQAIYIQSLDTEEVKDSEDRAFSGMRVIRRRYP